MVHDNVGMEWYLHDNVVAVAHPSKSVLMTFVFKIQKLHKEHFHLF